jgi:pimeloyl-ACP methyl ester carboxylesterase
VTLEIRSGYAHHGDIELHYEDLGDISNPPVLLIMGLGAQLVLWHSEFCQKLIDLGYRVIRYDNRDVGLSSKLHDQRHEGSLVPKLLRGLLGLRSQCVYHLNDMAEDAAAVLDHLGIERAHIVGASLGGMIAQLFAARFPERTGGLGIIFSSNNSALLPPPAPKALMCLIKVPPPDASKDDVVGYSIRLSRVIGSPGYPRSDERLRKDATEAYDRAYYPQGIARQYDAALSSGSLRRYDLKITAPTVVIHGREDILMRPSGGRAIASAIPGARLVMFDGMAHDLPDELFDPIVKELHSTFSQA